MAEKCLKFNEQKLIHNFSVTGSNPSISIKKIVIDSLVGQGLQFGTKLTKLAPMLQITFFKVGGLYMESPISLNAYISPYHIQPVIEFNKKYPDSWNGDEIRNFDLCKLEITYTRQPDIKLDISIYYDATDMDLIN